MSLRLSKRPARWKYSSKQGPCGRTVPCNHDYLWSTSRDRSGGLGPTRRGMRRRSSRAASLAAERAEVEAAEAERLAVDEAAATEVEAVWAEHDAAWSLWRNEYPRRLRFPYRLDEAALGPPFEVEALWHDGRFTYLRSRAEETPALCPGGGGCPPRARPAVCRPRCRRGRSFPGKGPDPTPRRPCRRPERSSCASGCGWRRSNGARGRCGRPASCRPSAIRGRGTPAAVVPSRRNALRPPRRRPCRLAARRMAAARACPRRPTPLPSPSRCRMLGGALLAGLAGGDGGKLRFPGPHGAGRHRPAGRPGG